MVAGGTREPLDLGAAGAAGKGRYKELRDRQEKETNLPGLPKECCLEVFDYMKLTKKHALGVLVGNNITYSREDTDCVKKHEKHKHLFNTLSKTS